MPLNDVARRYAERLFQKSQEEIIRKQLGERARVNSDFKNRNMTASGMYVSAQGRVLIDQIQLLGDAKADSLLKAYERAGLPFDDAALHEIQSEVMEFCHRQQHGAVSAIGRTATEALGSSGSNVHHAVANEIINGVSGIMARISRDLGIKRDEVILDEMKTRKVYAAGLGKKWDVFVCHASEDKDAFVRPLAKALEASGLSVWYDESSLTIGDSLRRKIDEGLASSRYGVVVLSKSFFAKNWPQQELDGLLSREVAGGTKVILPVWHNISLEEMNKISPLLAGKLAAKS